MPIRRSIIFRDFVENNYESLENMLFKHSRRNNFKHDDHYLRILLMLVEHLKNIKNFTDRRKEFFDTLEILYYPILIN